MSDQSTGGGSAASLMTQARDAAGGAYEEARSKAAEVAPRIAAAARAEAMDRAEGAKDGLAEQGERLAQSLRSAVSGGDDSIQAKLMAAAADSVEDLAGTLRGRSLDQLLADAGGFARRNPGAFVVAAALAGFAAARFARASAPASQAYGGIEGDGVGASYGSPRPIGSGYAGGSQGGMGGSDSFGSGRSQAFAGSSGPEGLGYGAGRVQGVVSTSSLSTHDDDEDPASADVDRDSFGTPGGTLP